MTEDQQVMQRCLAILDFTEPELDTFFTLPDMEVDGESVPVSYIRSRLPDCQLDPRRDADYSILILDQETNEIMFESGMHDLVWRSQCSLVLDLAQDGSTRLCRLSAAALPVLPTFITWLYTNNQQRLYDDLEAGIEQSSPDFAAVFCRVVRCSGCVDYRHAGVIRALFDPDVHHNPAQDNVHDASHTQQAQP